MGKDAFTHQFGAPPISTPSRSVGALSPIVRCPFGSSSEGTLCGLCEGGAHAHRASRPVARPAHRLNP
eukprot:8708883-Alexandrium_andersonii.AAC.1